MWHRRSECRKSWAGGLQLDECGRVQISRARQDVWHTCTTYWPGYKDATCIPRRFR